VTVVQTARALEPGAPLVLADVAETRVPAADALAGLPHSAAALVGRRVLIGVPVGTLLADSMLTDAPPIVPGHRLVRLPVDAVAMPPGLVSGSTVDVLAAVASADAADAGGRVLTVTSARLIKVSGGSTTTLTLDCDAAGAARLLWAQSFAKSMRVLIRPPGDTAMPPDVGGLVVRGAG
jgi:SAF domain